MERVILAWKRTGHLVSQDLIRNHKDKQKMKIKMQQQYGPFSRPKGKIGEGGLQPGTGKMQSSRCKKHLGAAGQQGKQFTSCPFISGNQHPCLAETKLTSH